MATLSVSQPSLASAVASYLDEHALDPARLARAAGVSQAKVQAIIEDSGYRPDGRLITAVAKVIGISRVEFVEYRVVVVLRGLAKHSELAHALFLESLSQIERDHLSSEDLSHEPLAETVWAMLRRDESTQQELAEGIGVPQSYVSRAMNDAETATPDLLEAIAQGLGVGAEVFVEYRLMLVGEWLLESPGKLNELYDKLTARQDLDEYRAWSLRQLPAPDAVTPIDLVKSLLEIISVEGPVVGWRVYQLRLEAAGLRETKDLRSLLNRASAAAARANLIVAVNETDESTQKYCTLRVPSSPTVHLRTLGPRQVAQVPRSELTALIRVTTAWKQGGSTQEIQRAITEAYEIESVSRADVEHVNVCINKSREGTTDG